MTAAPDVIFRNGQVLGSAGPAGPLGPPSAVAVTGNRISALGDDDLVDSAGPSTSVVDLGGRTLLPGINDGHLHIGGFASGRPPVSIDVSPAVCPTVRSVAGAVAEQAATVEPGTWIRGRGWVGAALADLDGSEPSADLLDAVSPVNPVMLGDFSGHAIWVNSAAMVAAGIDRETVIPAGGLARRDGAGEFTGLFVDAAQMLITTAAPSLGDAELETAVRAAIGELHRQGITSMTDAALNPLPGAEDRLGGARVYELLRRICGRDDVPMRTNVLVCFSPLAASMLDDTVAGLDLWERPESDRSWFNVRGLKIFADGVPPSCTSWMSTPYPDGSHGCLTVGGDTDADRVEELELLIRAGHDRGLQVGVHATGDLAIEAVVDGFAATLAAGPRPHRHYIIHGPLAPPDLLARAGALGLGFNVQPSLKSTSARAIEGMFGRELSEWQWPLRAMLDSGSVLAASSDAPVCEPNWRHGVAGAVLRETDDGEVYGADQRIRVDEAIHAYTAAGAWQDDADGWKGSIDVGKVADLCVVDARLSTDDPRTFADAAVSLTMVDGVVVHGALEE
ncbi:MAG: amidohydrolase [Actinomycetota bacterium]